MVTGASRGLGRAIAVALASSGASLALLGRDREQLEITLSEAKQAGGEGRCLTGDISRPEEIKRLHREVLEQIGGADILINNAGVNLRKPVMEISLEEWNQVMATNLTAVFLFCQAFVPYMRSQHYGRIINIASIFSHVSFPARGAYATSKTGLLGLSRSLALELAPDGITVVSISPGPIATEMTEILMKDPEAERNFLAQVPVRRWGAPKEVGELAAFLCSDGASFITGSDILIDGGWCAQ